jgi:cytochrome c2
MKASLSTLMLIAAILGAAYRHYAFAEEKKIRQQDWSVAEKLFETKCKLCHSIDRPKNAKKTYEEWKSTVTRMKSYAPVITDEQAELIIDYLSHHYGRK